MDKRGFTLIELIMVIVILGILAVVAIPRYIDLRTQAEEAAVAGVVGGVRGGIHTYYANQAARGFTPLFPASLEGADANNLFEVVLSVPVPVTAAGAGWNVDGAGLVYTYTFGDGTTDIYTYDAAGSFTDTGGTH